MNVFRSLSLLALSVIAFIYSFYINQYALVGDQEHYRAVYEYIKGKDLLHSYIYYNIHLDSKEIVHFILSWVFSNIGVEKDVFISLCNALLVYIFLKLAVSQGGSLALCFILVITSFYFNVLFFSAERLKFGILFLLVFYLSVDRKYKNVFAILSIISHMQMVILYFSKLFPKFAMSIVRFVKYLFFPKSLLVLLLVSIAVFGIFYDHISHKLIYYLNHQGYSGLMGFLKLIALMLLTIFSTNRKAGEVILVFIPLVFAASFIGSERIFILGYFSFLYFSVGYKSGFNAGFLLLMGYTTIKGFYFIVTLIEHGNGFYVG